MLMNNYHQYSRMFSQCHIFIPILMCHAVQHHKRAHYGCLPPNMRRYSTKPHGGLWFHHKTFNVQPCKLITNSWCQEWSSTTLTSTRSGDLILLVWMICAMQYFVHCQQQTGKHVSEHFYQLAFDLKSSALHVHVYWSLITTWSHVKSSRFLLFCGLQTFFFLMVSSLPTFALKHDLLQVESYQPRNTRHFSTYGKSFSRTRLFASNLSTCFKPLPYGWQSERQIPFSLICFL